MARKGESVSLPVHSIDAVDLPVCVDRWGCSNPCQADNRDSGQQLEEASSLFDQDAWSLLGSSIKWPCFQKFPLASHWYQPVLWKQVLNDGWLIFSEKHFQNGNNKARNLNKQSFLLSVEDFNQLDFTVNISLKQTDKTGSLMGRVADVLRQSLASPELCPRVTDGLCTEGPGWWLRKDFISCPVWVETLRSSGRFTLQPETSFCWCPVMFRLPQMGSF